MQVGMTLPADNHKHMSSRFLLLPFLCRGRCGLLQASSSVHRPIRSPQERMTRHMERSGKLLILETLFPVVLPHFSFLPTSFLLSPVPF